ncbi:Rrf2 family transcriptional regulator [Acaricomes phytoseiuli]|uniref:RrF2 family transcriptional regulator n=1 Tax=Acaricomes phytoseiuli TaxID=291968 RepID=UPI002222F205|nr:Rrf2 family transcriptional regulator [Acaricomes phytoseiuli]MCW1249924.1 Rrf2 family transcriptional regulator [Acaricomes phytoseiuli]
MRVNLFADASLRAMMLLSATEHSLRTQQIAEAAGIPYHHMSKAVQRLSGLGLVETTRGRGGGVRLSPVGRESTVGGILRALNTDEYPAACVTDGGQCPLFSHCRLRDALTRARESFYRELDSVRITDLSHPAQVSQILLPGIES